MDDFRIGSTAPYDANRNGQRLADANRKKAKHPKSVVPEDEVHVGQSTESDLETEDNLGVQDYYTPTDRRDEPE
jgi:hypothetical protein